MTVARSGRNPGTGASWRARSARRRPWRRERGPGPRGSARAGPPHRRAGRRAAGVLDRRVDERARDFLRSRLDELPVEVNVDAAGNLWATMAGERRRLRDRRLARGLRAGGWLARRRARRVHGRRGASHPGRERAAAGWAAARGLGRRGGRPFRPQPVRVVVLCRHARARRGARPARSRRRAPRGGDRALRAWTSTAPASRAPS